MIECPRCGSANTRALTRSGSQRPVKVRNVIIRQHSCGECAFTFRSYQIVPVDRVTFDLVAEVLEGEVA